MQGGEGAHGAEREANGEFHKQHAPATEFYLGPEKSTGLILSGGNKKIWEEPNL